MSTYTPTAHEPGCGCKNCAAVQRNRFFKGKLMKAPEFAMEQAYGIERRRLLTRELAGWGVLRGLAVSGTKDGPADEFRISAGLAIDCHGREILLCDEAVVDGRNTCVIAENCELKSVDKLEPGSYVLAVHYAEFLFGDAAFPAECCGTKTEKNYVCEGAIFSLRRVCGDCPCGEPPCPKCCRCHCGKCRGEHGRGSHLCCWTGKADAPCPPSKPCRWRDYDFYVDDGVDLACLHVHEPADRCHPPKGHIEDDCGPRRIVKSNDLLYDLIRGCDLTRIGCLSWGEWHRRRHRVPWEEFLRKLKGEEPHALENEVRITGFEVAFTGPVKNETVRPDCFALKFTVGRNWRETHSVEIVEVILSGRLEHDPPETSRRATLCVSDESFEDLTCHGSRIRREGAEVCIEVRGDYILDCYEQAVDANAHGFALHGDWCEDVRPSGNGTPGGTLVSTFRVDRAQPEIR